MEVKTFLVSLIVAVATIWLAQRLSEVYVGDREARLRELASTADPVEAAGDEPAASPPEGLSFIYSPEFFGLRLAQAIDIATNAPTAVLTLIAFSDLYPPHSGETWIYVLVTLAICFLIVKVANPRAEAWYARFWLIRDRVSYLSALIVVANVVGLGLAISKAVGK